MFPAPQKPYPHPMRISYIIVQLIATVNGPVSPDPAVESRLLAMVDGVYIVLEHAD